MNPFTSFVISSTMQNNNKTIITGFKLVACLEILYFFLLYSTNKRNSTCTCYHLGRVSHLQVSDMIKCINVLSYNLS